MAFANRQSAGTIWLPTGNPDTTNIDPQSFGIATLTPTGSQVGMGGQPGSLGIRFEAGWANRAYQRVQLDSGATAATTVGVVLVNQVAYWKDKLHYIVTNDVVQANAYSAQALTNSGFRNFIAGIFRSSALTPGYFIDVLQRGVQIPVKTTGAPAIGDVLVSDVSTTAAQAATVTAGTAPGAKAIGVVSGATSGAGALQVTLTDVDIPEVQ
jgi:hypothetical protein